MTSPADNSSVTGVPGDGHRHDRARQPGLRLGDEHRRELGDDARLRRPPAAGGAFSVDVAVTGGTSVLNIVAVSPTGGTAHEKRTVVFDFVPGTLLLDVTDPNGDDNGPGNYAYPTSDNFQPGAFDIQQFQVYDAGSDVIFRLQTRDLTPTFGSPLGAQLVDVYVHVPGAAPTSTAAATATRNFTIAAPFAWSRLIQVQGFGQRYVDATGATLGTVAISANEISRFITFRVPKATLGTPGPGWGFTVVLTGQDGFSSDQARGFQPTPQDFQFGVCAAASADPHCTVRARHRPEGDRRDHAGRACSSRPSSTTRSGRSSCRASRSRNGPSAAWSPVPGVPSARDLRIPVPGPDEPRPLQRRSRAPSRAGQGPGAARRRELLLARHPRAGGVRPRDPARGVRLPPALARGLVAVQPAAEDRRLRRLRLPRRLRRVRRRGLRTASSRCTASTPTAT